MKHSYDQTLLVFILLGLLSHVEALSSYHFFPGENEVIIETATGQVPIPVRDDVIMPNSSVYINGTTLKIIYRGKTISIINTDTNALEAGVGFIRSDTPDPILGDFFTLNIQIGSGSDTPFSPELPDCTFLDKHQVKIKRPGFGTGRTRPNSPNRPNPIDGDFFTLGVKTGSSSDTRSHPELLGCISQDKHPVKIKGTGSGTVRTPHNLYSGDQCVDIPCQEIHPIEKLIIFTATPDVGSSLTEWDCGDETIADSEEKGHYCVARFDLIPPLDSTTFSRTAIASATLAGGTLAGGVFRKDEPPQKNIELDSSNPVEIKGLITVKPEHIEQMAERVDIIVVASHVSWESDIQTWYMRDGEMGVGWDGNIENLSAFKKNIRLETQHVELYRGPLPEGSWEMYFGYRLRRDGTLIYNSEPITIQITP